MKWKILEITTWNPGLIVDAKVCKELFGKEVASMSLPCTRYFYDGEDLIDLNQEIFTTWIRKHGISNQRVRDLIVGHSYLPDDWSHKKPGIECAIANALELENCEPSYIANRYCSTIPAAIEMLDNKRAAERRIEGDIAFISVMDFPSLILRKEIGHHKISQRIFGDGAFFMLLELVDGISHGAPGYLIDDVSNSFITFTSDKAYADENGAIILSQYMTDDVPDLIYDEGIKPFLKQNNLSNQDIRYWILHPGGIPIISGVEKRLGLKIKTLSYAYDTFCDGGNRYATAAGFVFDRVDKSHEKRDGDKLAMITASIGIYLGAVMLTYHNP